MSTENKYINATALIAELLADDPSNNIPEYMKEHCRLMVKILEEYPSADVVLVQWKPVVGYEELYEVSDNGQVRAKNGKIKKQQSKPTKYTVYKKVSLYKDGKYHQKYVHRLMAEAFLENPHNLPVINHKDENGENNMLYNIEWCSRSYNARYGSCPVKIAKSATGRPSYGRKAVVQLDRDGNFIKRYKSITAAGKAVNGNMSKIVMVCKGKRKTAHGYKWVYDTEYNQED